MRLPSRKDHLKVRLRYIAAAVVAVLLTVATPRTRLWNHGMEHEITQSYATLNPETLLELLVIFVTTIASFLFVQGSDPGYLTEAVMNAAVANEDGLSLLGDSNHSVMEMEEPIVGVGDGMAVANIDRGDDDDPEEARDKVSPLEIDVPSNRHNRGKGSNHDLASSAVSDIYSKRQRRYCPKCKFAPPLRAHHCKHCDVCVATFDHHCHFIGTCIGERNHCRFWWFLTFQLIGFCTMVSIINSKKRAPARKDDLDNEYVPEIFMVVFASCYLWPLLVFALLMWIVHTSFAITNSTSFECSKGPRHLEYLHGTRECDYPFSNGMDHNIRNFCCLRDEAWNKFIGKRHWTPTMWKPPGKIIRDSDDCFEHPWENKYYSCC
mmetsp:Transcript_24333/g.36429  ORF Transcript_24333/g.36429 Transcript_24333/m.36429 type:complete len:378 (+) Transcript_24333:108-1241(+)